MATQTDNEYINPEDQMEMLSKMMIKCLTELFKSDINKHSSSNRERIIEMAVSKSFGMQKQYHSNKEKEMPPSGNNENTQNSEGNDEPATENCTEDINSLTSTYPGESTKNESHSTLTRKEKKKNKKQENKKTRTRSKKKIIA